jgi:hypothetical protein
MMKFTIKKSFALTKIRTRISQLPVECISQLPYQAILSEGVLEIFQQVVVTKRQCWVYQSFRFIVVWVLKTNQPSTVPLIALYLGYQLPFKSI